ncbi:GntR family transcriptional regulator [Haematomicrobium sanguinis]|uniref:GntR family transcriptional regulator n=1 Tax=Haematomicrobium sanguinis TaxID=479106 RepID=UPI000A0128DD|nr:GntR family transcriptional regulator [Haematomicrobium sanguinis]
MIDDSRPIFEQVAQIIANDIISGALAEEAQAPSTNEFAAFYRINPATAAKGINRLVDQGILYKRRGIGMFVAPGAKEKLMAQRREEFTAQYLQPLVAEAAKLGLSAREVSTMITENWDTAADLVTTAQGEMK